jgi:DNA adenine methylase
MVEPFLKWPGGKRWLVKEFPHLFPKQFDRYIEPFLGSGAVFFKLCPKAALLADSNPEVVNAFELVKTAPESIQTRLAALQRQHSRKNYYLIRERTPRSALGRASRFIYLNRTCFNGIYRVNKLGQFNVPIGTKSVVCFTDGYLDIIARTLCGATIRRADFEDTINEAKDGDFVFIDPPYTVRHNNNNFLKYNAHLFSWDDQVRLARSVRAARERGALIMLCNANHRSVVDLYRGFGKHHVLERQSVIAANRSHRGQTTELIITSGYKSASL